MLRATVDFFGCPSFPALTICPQAATPHNLCAANPAAGLPVLVPPLQQQRTRGQITPMACNRLQSSDCRLACMQVSVLLPLPRIGGRNAAGHLLVSSHRGCVPMQRNAGGNGQAAQRDRINRLHNVITAEQQLLKYRQGESS